MISGGSRSFAKGEGQLLFQSRKFQNWVWPVLFMEKYVRVQPPSPPPFDPPLISLIKAANVDSTV